MNKATELARTSAKGGFNLFWGVVASSIISTLSLIMVARILSPSEYGLFAIVLIAPNLIQLIRDFRCRPSDNKVYSPIPLRKQHRKHKKRFNCLPYHSPLDGSNKTKRHKKPERNAQSVRTIHVPLFHSTAPNRKNNIYFSKAIIISPPNKLRYEKPPRLCVALLNNSFLF